MTALLVGGIVTAAAGVLGIWIARQIGRAAHRVGVYLAEIARTPTSVDNLVVELRRIGTQVADHDRRLLALENPTTT